MARVTASTTAVLGGEMAADTPKACPAADPPVEPLIGAPTGN